MKLEFWGTAACAGIPGVFCNCEICREARKKGGRSVRTRSQMMIDRKILVDMNADTYTHFLEYGYDGSQLTSVIMTHDHTDHWFPANAFCRASAYSPITSAPCLSIYGSSDIAQKYTASAENKGYETRELDEGRLRIVTVEPFVTYVIEGISVTPLLAYHGAGQCYLYSLVKDGSAALIFYDTGMPPKTTLDWLRNSGICYDAVVYDCTFGFRDVFAEKGDKAYHLGVPNVLEIRSILEKNGNSDKHTKSYLTHISHNSGGVGYDDLRSVAEPVGLTVAYDGLTVEI